MKPKGYLLILITFIAVFPGGLLFADSPADRVTSTEITLEEGTVYFYNRAAVKYGPDGTGIIMWNIEDQGLYFMEIGPDLKPVPNTKRHLPEQYFLDFVIPDSDQLSILLQKREGLERYDNADIETFYYFIEAYNTLQLVNMDRYGNERFRTRVAGHQGIKNGSIFLCDMANAGYLGFDGSTYTIYSQICANSGSEQEPDVHEGDFFVQLDGYGREISGTRNEWGASHSSLPRLTVPDRGEAYTATIGDCGPYGLQMRGYKDGKNIFTVVPYPDEEELPYSNMYASGVVRWSTDAGEIGNVLKIGDSIITVLATVESAYHPILDQPKDLLLVKLDTRGNTNRLSWIDQTGRTDESMPYIMPYEGNILLVYYNRTDKYEGATIGDAVMAVIDEYGRYVEGPVETDCKVNWYCRFFTFPNGDVGWTYIEAYDNTVTIYRVAGQSGGIPNDGDAGENDFWAESDYIYTGDPVVVRYSGLNANDWFSLVPAGSPDDFYDEDFWSYADDTPEGEYLFYPSAGEYELRLYRNWPDNGYTVDKRMTIEVITPR